MALVQEDCGDGSREKNEDGDGKDESGRGESGSEVSIAARERRGRRTPMRGKSCFQDRLWMDLEGRWGGSGDYNGV